MEVILRNGQPESKVAAATVFYVLDELMKTGKGHYVVDLVTFCRDPGHKMMSVIVKELDELNLIDLDPDGKPIVHPSIQNIVLSAVEGEGLEMTVVNPVR